MTGYGTSVEPADPEVVELADALSERVPNGEWRVWRGVNGLLYAWRKKTSPPLRFKGATVREVLAKVAEWVATGKRPEE